MVTSRRRIAASVHFVGEVSAEMGVIVSDGTMNAVEIKLILVGANVAVIKSC